MRRTIVVHGTKLIYSPERHGYIDPEDHGGLTGRPERVWHIRRKIKRGHPHREIHHPRRSYSKANKPHRAFGRPAIIFFSVSLIIIGVIVASFMGVHPLVFIKDTIVAAIPGLFTVSGEEIQAREHEVVDLVNAIRVERGLEPLIWDDTLYGYSKSHSADMAKLGLLFHTPAGTAPYAENVWGGESHGDDWSAEEIVNAWMTSPGHRTWLLCPHLQHIAVGIAQPDNGIFASWTFWIDETWDSDW
jgi:hypothetical protein